MASNETASTVVRAIDQITLTDITDNYTVELSKDSYVFTGDSPSGASSGSCSTIVKVYKGGEELKKQKSGESIYPVLKSVTVSNSDTVINTVMNSNSGKWSGDTWTPYQLDVNIKSGQTLTLSKEIPITITIAFSSSATDDVVLTKTFTVTTTKNGSSVTVTGTEIRYGYSTSGIDYSTVTNWGANVPSVPLGQYLWTRTIVTYSTGTSTTSYSVSYAAQNGTSQYTFIRYSADDDTTSGGAAMHDTPQTGDIYIGIVNVTTNSAPTTKSSYTWSKYVGEDGTDGADGFSIWTTTATPSSSQFNISDLTGPSGVTPRVGEAIIRSNRYQYTITAVSSTKVTVGTAVDLKGSNGTSIVWKGDLASAPSNPQTLWAYYNTTDKKSYIYNGSSWDQMTTDGTNATQYYYHVVYCNNTSTGAGYSTTASNQTYTGTYTDTTVADAADWATAQTKNIKWNYTKGAAGDNGYNVATVNVYKTSLTQPSKPYINETGTITYTFSSNSFSPALTDSWSLSFPSVGSSDPIWVSTINLTSQNSSVTIDKTKWSDPVILADETKAIFLTADSQTFQSSDGGNTYTPNTITITPRFQNTTYKTNGWSYINNNGTEVPLTDSGLPNGISLNATTKALTISKDLVSDAASGSALFKGYKLIVFKCKANEKDASNNYIYDTFTIAKIRDGVGFSSVVIKYAQSSSGSTPPSQDSSSWKDSISEVGTIPAGYFLWTWARYTYTDSTTKDTYTKAMQGLTGKGISSITPLHYLVGPIYECYRDTYGYFWEDSAHTIEINPEENAYYFDKTTGENKYYKYIEVSSNVWEYDLVGTDVKPAAPSAHVTETGDIANTWTTGVPHYITGGKYYICEEIAYDDTPTTYSWSAVVLDNMVTDAYIEIDKNTGQINLISEQILNLEQTDEVTGASVTFQKDCYVGTLHKLTISPTGSNENQSVEGLFPKTTLYPSTSLYPREMILIVDCGQSSIYGTKYKYYIDIDKLNWTNVEVYDEFVYEDGKCWIIRRTLNNGNVVETIDYRNPMIPVDSVIDVGGEEVQVSNSLIYIPEKTNVTLRLIGANGSTSDPAIRYKVTYLIDNPYTSNFTSSLDLVSQINMSPGNIKIKANHIGIIGKDNISLEGYTTINDGFKIDLQGNMECMDAKINGNLVTENGVLTSITYTGSYWTCYYPFDSPKKYQLDMGNSLPFIGFNTSYNGSIYTFYEEFLNFNVLIPNNFIPVNIRVIAHSSPAWVGYGGSNEVLATPKNIKIYKANNLGQSNMLNINSGAQIDGCVPTFTPLNIPAHDFSSGVEDDWIFEGDVTETFNGPGLYNITMRTANSLPSNVSSVVTARDTIAACSGIITAICQIVGYMK